MKMRLTAQLGGIYPRSEQLVELTRSYDTGKTDQAALEKQFEQDTRELVEIQDDSGFESLTDGALSWQDQLRPIVESFDGISTGTRYSRWFDTNTFYKKPTVDGPIRLGRFDPKKFVRSDLLPQSKTWKVTLIGPYSFAELAENMYYETQIALVSDVANAEREIIHRLRSAGVSQFQLSEPCLVYRPYREQALTKDELEGALAAISKTVEGVDGSFQVQTYFGDATPILPHLLKLPVEGVGFDLFETDYSGLEIETDKRLALGIIDGRESNVETPRWIAETASRVTKHVVSEEIVFVPNSDLKFVPRTVADAKARSLAEATRILERN
jgi:5-methyltetrahydropteroyltriglutamate--homocysteine methyltransferase